MARAAAGVLIVALGAVAAIAVTKGAHADPPVNGAPATVYRTVTETRTTERRIERHGVLWWRARAVRNRRTINDQRSTIRSSRLMLRRRWAPTVRYGLALAAAAFGYDQTHRAVCESQLNPFAAEGHGPLGLLQFQPSTWAHTPFGGFSIYDPVAQALAGGWMIEHGRSSEWSCGL